MKNQKFLRSANNIFAALCLCILLFSCKKETPTSNPSLFDLTEATTLGIDFQNTLVETDSLNILDYLYMYNGGGLAMGDIDGNGFADLYFSANQGQNKLYLNQGDLSFTDATNAAGVAGNSDWNTGAIMGDFNADGLLDIYVLAVVGINGFEGHNELFINKGDGTFSEQAAQYGLDVQAYGTTAGQLDYDGDGDLDLFILNHAVHTEESFGRASIREDRNPRTGDLLFRNDGERYTDVSEEAGIYGGINGYGLGLAIADFNKDGWPDLYIGNDFHEDDYYYLNNGDGTFTDQLRTYFGHTSRFSMGSDAADINNDGWPDLISLDMTPEDEKVLKSSEGDDTYRTLQLRTQQYGYHYQYTRNMLFLNQGGHPYLETALLSGIPSTDWSWSALFADYDLDGNLDLFVSNGIPRRPNDLDFIRFVSNSEIQKQMNQSKLVDQQALELMPSGAVNNYIYQGDGKGGFINKNGEWAAERPSVSAGTVVGDLDGDGDLDLVTNNLNEPPYFYINQTNKAQGYLSIGLKYIPTNPFGLGTEVLAYSGNNMQSRQLFPSRGWQASSEPRIHFGLGDQTQLDSLRINWPDGTSALQTDLGSGAIEIAWTAGLAAVTRPKVNKTLFTKVDGALGINFTHKEDQHTDFDYQKLIPFQVSDRGPAVSLGDFNLDGKEDLYLGGAKNQPSSIYVQDSEGFSKMDVPAIAADSLSETVDASFDTLDANSQWMLGIAQGGNHINPSLAVLRNKGIYKFGAEIEVAHDASDMNNTAVYRISNIEDQPAIFIGNHSVPLDYGNIPPSYVKGVSWEGDGKIGMVTDAVWDDFDADGDLDLIVVGEWMQPTFFSNENGTLTKVSVLEEQLGGLWQTIIPFDMDNDGDQDYLLGNWGLNSKFKASASEPMKMYYDDFDQNGTTETVIAVANDGSYYPLLGMNDLAEQMVGLRKRFNAFKDFAGKPIEVVMGEEALQQATLFEVHTLASGFLRNNNNRFTFEAFSNDMQLAPIRAFVPFDFDGDGAEEVLAAGNYFGVIPFHGRYDAFPGAMLEADGTTKLANRLGIEIEHRTVKAMKVLTVNNQPYLLIVYNNDAVQVYEIGK